MKIQKKYSYEPNSTWKIINLADDYFLVNELSMKDYIKVDSRYKALKKVDFDETVDDIELYSFDTGYIFKFYNDIYEITEAIEIDLIMFSDYDYNNDDVILIATHGKKKLSFISFWYDEQASEMETFQELYTISLSLFPRVTTLDSFMKRLFYYEKKFYYHNYKSDKALLRFDSERLDTYDIPDSSTFYFNDKFKNYYYVCFNNSLIDILKFKMYDISEIVSCIGDNIKNYRFMTFNLDNPSMDFIFLYESQDLFIPNLVTKGIFTEAKGYLYNYSHKEFVFSNTLNSFMIYDYSVPNIIKENGKYKLFYLDKTDKVSYFDLPFDLKVITYFDDDNNQNIWNKFIFIENEKSAEQSSAIMIKNSIFLNSFMDYTLLNKAIYIDTENDSIKFILAKIFDRCIAANSTIINMSSYKKIFYLYGDDCFTIEFPLSECGKYTLVFPKQIDNIDPNLSFNSFKKFTLFRKGKDKTWDDHLILKCIYINDENGDQTAYIDVSIQGIVHIDDLIDDGFHYE